MEEHNKNWQNLYKIDGNEGFLKLILNDVSIKNFCDDKIEQEKK